ncbi:MAG: anti-sigma factor [Pirellulaceae bacterium]
MNRKTDTIDDALLDRLADGELSPVEYRRVLQWCEQHPDGWRRCASAFLEAQAWRGELSRWVVPPPVARAEPEPGMRRPARDAGWLVLTAAASFLAAFGFFRALFPVGIPAGSPVPDGGVAETRPAQPATDPRLGDYHLVVSDQEGSPQHVQLPIYSADDPRARMLMNHQASQPAELIQALRELGFQVNRERRWATVGQDPERPVVVPVEELEITPVSSQSYH